MCFNRNITVLMDQKEGTNDKLYLGMMLVHTIMKKITTEKKSFQVHFSCAHTNEMWNCCAYAHLSNLLHIKATMRDKGRGLEEGKGKMTAPRCSCSASGRHGTLWPVFRLYSQLLWELLRVIQDPKRSLQNNPNSLQKLGMSWVDLKQRMSSRPPAVLLPPLVYLVTFTLACRWLPAWSYTEDMQLRLRPCNKSRRGSLSPW